MNKNADEPVLVTKPFLPPIEEFIPYLEEIWRSRRLTNNGPFHQQFEKALAEYLGVRYISLFTNGTLALMTALQTLRIAGEVITTPFSFVATTHSLWWNNIKPVFADIEPDFFNLDPVKAEAAITPHTTAIMPVHVYGYPCQLDAFKRIGESYGVKIIYDACHAFGVQIHGQSVLNFGDLSVMSFHATKVFNTFEGGAIVCHDEGTKIRIDYLKNFGFAGQTTIIAPGINAKMNEFQAALGLVQLNHVDEAIAKRKMIAQYYRDHLAGIRGLRFLQDMPGVRSGYPYFPVLVDNSEFGRSRDEVFHELKRHNIVCRRYFYPLISQFPIYRELPSAQPGNLPCAEKVAAQVICLPIYPELSLQRVETICDLFLHHFE